MRKIASQNKNKDADERDEVKKKSKVEIIFPPLSKPNATASNFTARCHGGCVAICGEPRMPERGENLITEGFEVEKMDERYNFSRSIFKVGSL